MDSSHWNNLCAWRCEWNHMIVKVTSSVNNRPTAVKVGKKIYKVK